MRLFVLITFLLISFFAAANVESWKNISGTREQMAELADSLTAEKCTILELKQNPENEVALDQNHFFNQDGTPDNNPVFTLTPGPGDPYGICKHVGNCAWIKKDSKMVKIGEVTKQVVDPVSKLRVSQTFIKVKYCYYREFKSVDGSYKVDIKEGEGWTVEDNIKFVKDSTLSVDINKLPAPGIDEPITTAATTKSCDKDGVTNELEKIKNTAAQLQQKILSPSEDPKGHIAHIQIADLLANQIGECPLPNPKIFNQPWPKSNNVYDTYVLPKLKQQRENLTNLTKDIVTENGQPISFDQIVSIDALARLLYAEMGLKCYKPPSGGTHYAEAVARMVINRDDDVNSSKYRNYAVSRFLSSARVKHDPSKPTLAMVATTPGQFSFWNRSISKKNENGVSTNQMNHQGLTQGLCPPSRPDKNFSAGRKPDSNDKDVWRDYVRIATRAVLFKNQFKNDTANVNSRHYTSGVDINNFMPKPVPPEKPIIYPEISNTKINGLNYTPINPDKIDIISNLTAEKSITNKSCLRLWDDTPERKRHVR